MPAHGHPGQDRASTSRAWSSASTSASSDLQLSDKVTLLTDPELVIVHVVAPRAEEVAATADAEAAPPRAAEPEVIKKGKVEGEGDDKDKKADKKEKK